MRAAAAPAGIEQPGVAECLDRLASGSGGQRPLGTYRLQFHKGFRFADATALVDYLAQLGVSHVYASPILEARPGSTHGYDIINHNRLNPELGSGQDFDRLAHELRARSMGIVLDVVPNHMGIGNSAPWWRDVLRNGRASSYADFFDIDWEPLKPELRDKLLLPILGCQYGEELEQGKIQLALDEAEGEIVVRYYEHSFPLDPQTVPLIFDDLPSEDLPCDGQERFERERNAGEPSLGAFRELLRELRDLPPHSLGHPEVASERRWSLSVLLPRMRELFRVSAVQSVVEQALTGYRGTPGEPSSFDRLHRLLEAQVYRLAYWRVSGEEINYRRFFDVNDLVGVSMENPRVFAETHRLLRKLLADGVIEGIRIDHCDGLYNPYQYLVRLQMLYAASQCYGAEPTPPLAENGIELGLQRIFGQQDWMIRRPPLYTVVEKILEPGEDLPAEWPLDGTSGYDFTNLANGLFVDSSAERAFTAIYEKFLGHSVNADELIYQSKKLIMDTALAGEVNVLTDMLAGISSADRRARDFTMKSLRDAIRETIACFPVYRSYVDERGKYADQDRRHVLFAVSRAKRLNAVTSSSVFDFLREILLLERGQAAPEVYRRKQHFVLKFQQLTGPVMAKGVEDTVCYVYNRFVSLNEVGGSPKEFGISVPEFHAANRKRADKWPYSMLCTSTHDTKRSEDVRARLNVLSEMPRQWPAAVQRWRRLNHSQEKALGDGRIVPDANEMYLLYQTLVGMWPWDVHDPAQRDDLIRRARQYMTKAVHEAKVNLSWINQDQEYVHALQGFITAILEPGPKGQENRFVRVMDEFARGPAYFGVINSLAQTVLKCTSPGNPDLYQGTELWDFSLVDPDNRRPVDFALRQRLLGELQARSFEGNLTGLCQELLTTYQDGRVKLWTILRALGFRREHPEFFHAAGYGAIYARGTAEKHVVAFAREPNAEASAAGLSATDATPMMLVAVPRLPYTLMRGKLQPPLGLAWGDTELELPRYAPQRFENIFTGEILDVAPGKTLLCREVFVNFPVAVLWGR